MAIQRKLTSAPNAPRPSGTIVQLQHRVASLEGELNGLRALVESIDTGLQSLGTRVTNVEFEFPEGTF